MNIYYFFDKHRPLTSKNIVKAIYGDDVKYISELPSSDFFNDGDIFIAYSVDDLQIDYTNKINTDLIVKKYMEIYKKGVELVFDFSTQCNSLFIKTIISNDGDFENTLRKCIANFINQNEIHRKYMRRHIATASENGNRVGIKKGTKLVTKKSIETKEKIKELSKDFNGDKMDTEIMQELGISKNAYYKYKKELRSE